MSDTVPEFKEPVDVSLRRHPLAHCEDCPLNNETTIFVPSENAEKQVRVAVCGEAPGYSESIQGRPFVGPSGKLLDIVLQHNNLKREDVLYTNACLCRPKDNATPPKAATVACQPRLVSELENSGAEVVIALGGSAAESLLPNQGNITALRVGPPKTSPYLSTVKVIPTWHPAYCLRSAEAFPSMTTDIGKINELATPPWEPPEWRAYEDPEEALQVIDALDEKYNDLVIDIECGIEKDSSFDHPNRYEMLCVGIAYAKRRAVVIGEQAYKDIRVRDALRSLFQRKRLIAHNGKFDLAGLYPTLGPLELYFDTMLASYVLDSRTGAALHGLEVLSVEKLGTPSWKNEIKQYLGTGKNYANIPRPILYRYNAYDISCTWDLYEMFQEKLSTECPNWPYPDNTPRSARDVHDFLVAASNQLQYLELNGIAVDREYNKQLTVDYQTALNEREENLSDIIGREINPRSPKQVKEYLLSEGIQVPKTDKETLKNVQERIEPTSAAGLFIAELLEQRSEQKLFSTYVKGYTERLYGGRVFTTYKLIGTTSGRLASANPNLQNVVRNKAIKRQFVVSRPGNIFVHADYKQVEGRVITWLAKDEYLRSIFADPERDLFDELGSQLYRIPVPQLSKTQRVRTKAFFYGLCVPLNTLVLTRRGWLTYDQVIPGKDETIGYDFDLEKSRWVKIEEVITYDCAPLIKFGHSQTEFVTTPNHRWLSQKWERWRKPRRFGPIKFVETQELKADHRLNLAFQFESDSKLDITDQEAAILGWAYGDGTVNFAYKKGRSTELNVAQDVNSPYVVELDELFSNYAHSRYAYEGNPQIKWRLPSPTADDLLKRARMFNYPSAEEFAFSLSDSQRRAFWLAVLHAEGLKAKPNKVTQSEGWLLEVIKIVGYLEGYLVKPWFDKSSSKDKKDNYKITLAEPYLGGQKLKREEVASGSVFCLRTETGTWTMKQEGLTVLTGNSYGREAYSIGLEHKMPTHEAKRLYGDFFDLIPDTGKWQQKVQQQVLNGLPLITPFGRQRHFYLITKQNRKDVLNEALSFLPQSTASDVCLSALIRLRPMLRGKGFIRLTIHDALVVETNEELKDEVTETMSRVMVEEGAKLTNYVPFEVDVSYGTSWSDL